MMKGKGRRRQKLTVLVTFEPSRLGRAALEEAYERVAPSHGVAAEEPNCLAVVSVDAVFSGSEE